ncbi:MAG: hypothetical protein Q9M25_06485 [Mariprofundaceae bacterium]|nr:hypothetical protein [Mariprofundaceae bacterium]
MTGVHATSDGYFHTGGGPLLCGCRTNWPEACNHGGLHHNRSIFDRI